MNTLLGRIAALLAALAVAAASSGTQYFKDSQLNP